MLMIGQEEEIAEYFSVFISAIREFHLYLSIVNDRVNI